VGRYDGAIEIEESPGRLAAQSGGDVPGKVFIGLHWAASVCRFDRRQSRESTMTDTKCAFNTYCPCLSVAFPKRKITL
jgi:hypothetical protein